jgi:hypothetical protein
MKHILLNNLSFKNKVSLVPEAEFQYNQQEGIWQSNKDQSLLIFHENFGDIGSKKRDIETGEDQK